MKLIRKLNRQYVSYSFAVLLTAGIFIFFILKSIVREETDEKLDSIFNQIESLIGEEPQTLNLYPIILVQQVSERSNNRYFSDTTLYVKNELEEFRQLVGYSTVQNINYKIIVRESGIESRDLFGTLVVIILVGFLFIILSLYGINKSIARKIWSPFFENLEKLKRFSLQSRSPFIPAETNTDEFNEMNEVLKSLTNKVLSDYDNLKKFSENASHELQTPLAIIRSKIEAILDENSLSLAQAEKMQTIYQTVNRLSKINNGLIMLTKIENRQFSGSEEIDLNDMIESQIESFSDLIELKGLEFEYRCQNNLKITGDKSLTDVLISNLFSNAILHNYEKGQLIIELDGHTLKFLNPAVSEIPDRNRLFNRFYKSGTTGSTGLGLAIAKQICLCFRWDISYYFKDHYHTFKIIF